MLRHALLTLACFAIACSDVEEPDGTGAHAGADDGSGAGDSGSTLSKGELLLCEQFCESTGVCFPDCIATCESYLVAPCESQGQELVACMARNWDKSQCKLVYGDPETDCSEPTIWFNECRFAGPPTDCTPSECAGDENHCGCTRTCDGGQMHAICDTVNGSVTCECYFNSVPFGICSGFPPAPDLGTCNLETGCCAWFFGYRSQ